MTYFEETAFAHELTLCVHLDDHLLLSYGGADGRERLFDMSTDPESYHPRLVTRVGPCEAPPGHLAFRHLERLGADETKRKGVLSRWCHVPLHQSENFVANVIAITRGETLERTETRS